MRLHVGLIAAASWMAALSTAVPQDVRDPAPSATSAAPDDTIVVTAPTQDEAIRNFVGEIAATPSTIDKLARWDLTVCVRIVGVGPPFGQYLADRISARAFEVGLRPGGPHCRPRLFVIATSDPAPVISALIRRRAIMIFYGEHEARRDGRGQTLEDFASASQPVRWWHVAQTVTDRGIAIAQEGAPYYDDRGRSLTSSTLLRGRATRQDFERVIVVIDTAKVAGARFDSLADYISMVGLAQIDPRADTSGAPTILNLFARQPYSTADHLVMTDWDFAYLRGLYGDYAARFRRSAETEQRISSQMQHQLAASPPPSN